MNVFEDIMSGLQEAIEFEQGKRVLRTKKIKILPTPTYTKEDIKQIRIEMGLTQALFAGVVGVSKKTVEAWESGRNKPDGSSSRILQVIANNPDIVKEQGLLEIC